MKAKKTFYNNYYFRSKLEAKWAVFFDLMNIRWVYEPEAFICEDKSQYTPDFYLPDVSLRGEISGVYLEIKPKNYESNDIYEGRISSSIDKPLVLFCGDPIESIIDIQKHSPFVENKNIQLSPNWDNCMVFMFCEECGKVKIEFDEGNYYYCNFCNSSISCGIIASELEKQAIKARNFRFKFYNSENE